MIKITVKEFIQCLDSHIINKNQLSPAISNILEKKIQQIAIDSRSIEIDSVFVALPGEYHDGHDYLSQAQERGALLAIVSRTTDAVNLPQVLVSDPTIAMGVITKYLDTIWLKAKISITGSSGKTTTKFMLEKILNTKGKVLCAQSSFNNNIGVPLTMFKAEEQQWAGIFEIGTNHPGEIDYLTKLVTADVAILANISMAHIGNFSGLDDIALEKSCIFNGLKTNGIALIPYESDYKDFLLNRISKLNKDTGKKITALTFGYSEEADMYATRVHVTANVTGFNMHYKNAEIGVNLKLLGKHQVLNALAASLAACQLGLTLQQIKQGLESLNPVYKRMESKPLSKNLTLIDDSYNANPKSVSAALEFLAELPGKKVLVLGDMRELGELTSFEHEQIGRLARSLKIDKLYAFGDYAPLAMQIFDNKLENYQNKFADKQELVNTLIEYISDENNLGNSNHCTILLKGSNSTKMWEVGDKLQTILNNK